jgi:hypothetical protein
MVLVHGGFCVSEGGSRPAVTDRFFKVEDKTADSEQRHCEEFLSKRILNLMLALWVFTLLFCSQLRFVVVGLPTEALQTAHAVVYYNRGNDEKARWYGEAFELGYSQVGTDLGAYPSRRFTLYLYLTREDLVAGLQQYSGFSADYANWYLRTGATPRPINYVMHVSPNFDWHNLVHEYTHTVMEEISGRVYQSIKWLDEGLAEYEAYVTVLKTRYNQTEVSKKANAMRQVYAALDQGKIFSLGELSSDRDWSNRMGTDAGGLQYAEAWILVNYLATKYGSGKCMDILAAMKQSLSQELALQRELGTTMAQFETDFRQYLLKIRADAPVRIAEAEAAVQKAESEGRTVGLSQARTLIREAKYVMASSDYERAISFADEARDRASKATMPETAAATRSTTSTKSEMAATMAPESVAYAVIGVVVILAALLLVWIRGKKTSKQL